MKQWLISILMFLMATSIAMAATICEDKIDEGTTCTMLTPSLTCNTSYTIYNETSQVRTGNMTLLNDSIYYFPFVETAGDYIVKLCDNSTREIIVETEEDKTMTGPILLIIGIICLCLVLGWVFSREDNFTYFLSYLFYYVALLMPLFGIRIAASMNSIPQTVVDLLNGLYMVYLIIYLFLVLVGFVYGIWLLFEWMMWWKKTPAWKRKKLKDSGGEN